MDHKAAIETKAAERYVLRDMDDAERQAYEAHISRCKFCEEEVKRTATLRQAIQRVLKQDSLLEKSKRLWQRLWSRW